MDLQLFCCCSVIICLSFYVQCWTNFRVNLLSAEVSYMNPEYTKVLNFEIKKLNRSYTYLYVNVTSHKIIRPEVTLKMYRMRSNTYKEDFLPITVSICTWLSNDKAKTSSNFGNAFVDRLKVPLHEIIYASGQKIPLSCPIKADNYYMKLHVDEDRVPTLPFMEGKWKFDVSAYENKILYGNTSVYFEFVFFTSEKQKRRAG